MTKLATPTWVLERYVFCLTFNTHIPREIEPMVENILLAIPGVEEANIIGDWAEVKILQEYIDELEGDVQEYWDTLREKSLEVAELAQTTCLLIDKIGKS